MCLSGNGRRNNTPVTWNGARLEAQLPSGMRLANQSDAVAHEVETLAPNETLNLTLTVLLDSALLKRLAPTGDNGFGGIMLGCAAAAGFIALAAATLSRKNVRSRKARGGMSILMSVVLVVGFAPLLPNIAHAEEANAKATSFALEGNATCEKLGIVVPATLTVASTDQTVGLTNVNVEVANGSAVSANANYAHIDLVSDMPFTTDLSADDIALGGDFENLSVASVERTTDTTVSIRINNPGTAGGRGIVLFREGAFSNQKETGEAIVAVEEARIAFDFLSDACTYDGVSAFTIPVSLENARFAANTTAAQFIFTDPSLSATSLTIDANDDTRGMLTVTANAATPLEQFNALATALDASDQLAVDPTAIVGEAACTIAHPIYNDGDESTDDTISTAHAAAAVPYGTVRATSAVKNADGSITVSSTVTIGALDGTVNITDASQISLPGQASGTGGLLENSQVTLGDVRSDGFDFTFPISADTVSGWYDIYATSAATEEEANAQFLDEMTLLMRGHEIELADGVVLNKLGIPQGSCFINLSDEALVQAVGGASLFSTEEDTDAANEAFDILSKLASAIGYFVAGKTDIAQGVSQLLGIIASLLTTDPDYTIKDVLDELQQMKAQLSRMETSVDNQAIQLRKLDKRGGFESDWYEVKWRLDHLNSYGNLYSHTLGSLSAEQLNNNGVNAAAFEDLTPENQEALTSYKKSVDLRNDLLRTSVYADTMDLGSLILGTGTKNVVQDYYNWIETYYNWDPETFAIKQTYLNVISTAYINGYLSSMAYLSAIEGTGTPEQQITATLSKEELTQQAEQVMNRIAGTIGVDQSTNRPVIADKSPLRKAAEPLEGDRVRCLINDRVYDKNAHSTSLIQRNLYEGCRFSKGYEKDDVHMYTFGGSLNLAQWKQMAANLEQVRSVTGYEDVKTVYDELVKIGINLNYPSTNITVGNDWRGNDEAREVWRYDRISANQVVVSNASYSKTTDQYAVRHVRTVTVDVYDLTTNTVSLGAEAARHEGVYWVGHGWGYLHDIYPWRVS